MIIRTMIIYKKHNSYTKVDQRQLFFFHRIASLKVNLKCGFTQYNNNNNNNNNNILFQTIVHMDNKKKKKIQC